MLSIIGKIKNRMGSEQGFTLIELLVVIVILGVLVAIAVPSYLSFRGKAQTAAAEANVRTAIPAAESYYQTNGYSYAGLALATLQTEAPGIAGTVTAGPNASADGYCLQDTQGTDTWSYAGGVGGAGKIVNNACAAGYTLG